MLTAIVHSRNVFHDFLNWDDTTLLVQNPLLNPVSAEHLGRIWAEPVEGLYTPMAYTAWSAVAAVARVSSPDADGVSLNPMAFHLLNVLLHAVCVVIVFDVLHLLPLPEGEGTRTILPAAIGAAVFAVHPIQVEAVAWISGMNNLLAGLFSLACIAAYLRFVGGGRRSWYAVAMVAFVLALFSKPTALVTPLVILAIDVLVLRRPIRGVAMSAWPLAVLAVPFVIVGRIAQPAVGAFAPPLLQRLLVAGDAIGFYLCKLFCPWPLLMDYGRRPEVVATGAPSIPNFAALAVAIVLSIALWKRFGAFAASFAVFVAGIALVLGLVPFDFQAFSTVADRYVYLSMLGVAIGVACTAAQFKSIAVPIVAATLIAACAVVSFRQAGLWRDDQTIAGYTNAHNPTSLAAHMVLGCTAEKREDFASAESIYRDGLRLFPIDNGLNRNLGNVLFKQKRYAESIPYLQQSFLHTRRFDASLVNNLGSALLNSNLVPEAIDAFKMVTVQSPNHLNAHINLGHAYLMIGRLDLAGPPLQRALEIDPKSASAQRWMAVLRDGQSRSAPR